MPPVAGSGVGTDGWQMLFRSPTMPLEPCAQKPNRPPMSPIPGTLQIPPDGAAGCAGTWTAVVVTAPAGSAALAGSLASAWFTGPAAWLRCARLAGAAGFASGAAEAGLAANIT